MGQLSYWLPEAEALINVPQSPVHHPEGDAWTHTMMVLDAAASLRDNAAYPEGFMKAANSLDFLPEEQRVMMTTMFVGAMLIL